MRLAIRLLRPAPNQNIKSPRLWQDPLLGYFETHGKTEFLPGEEYNLTDEEKKAVLWRYRVKEILKKEYLRREYDPHNFKYKTGVIMDPAMFRWYSSEMYRVEYLRYTPRTVFLYIAGSFLFGYLLYRGMLTVYDRSNVMKREEMLWWDRQKNRHLFTCGSGAPNSMNGVVFGIDY